MIVYGSRVYSRRIKQKPRNPGRIIRVYCKCGTFSVSLSAMIEINSRLIWFVEDSLLSPVLKFCVADQQTADG